MSFSVLRRWRWITTWRQYPSQNHCANTRQLFNSLECRGNYSATSNNMKLVHWQLMGGLCCYIWYSEEGTGQGRSPPRPLIAVPNITARPSTASVPITLLRTLLVRCSAISLLSSARSLILLFFVGLIKHVNLEQHANCVTSMARIDAPSYNVSLQCCFYNSIHAT